MEDFLNQLYVLVLMAVFMVSFSGMLFFLDWWNFRKERLKSKEDFTIIKIEHNKYII